jgi:hypothetical protein
MNTLSEILSQKAPDFDAVKEARELRAALDKLTSKTPAIGADVVSPRDPTPATDSSVAEFRKLNRSGESQ